MVIKTESYYCPFCRRNISPEIDEDGDIITVDGGLIYVHDDVIHDEDFKFEALQ